MFNLFSISGYIDSFCYFSGDSGYSNWEFFSDWVNVLCCELVVGGLDSEKLLWVIGMGDCVLVFDSNFGDLVNCCIILVVFIC